MRIENEDQRADTLIKALDRIKHRPRDQLLSLIGRVGGKKLINFVAEIATGDDAARRKAGHRALSKWPDASVADKLLEITNKATDPAERSQAFQGYVKISATRDKRNDRQRLDRMKQAMRDGQRRPEEKSLVINRCRTAYDVETLRFVLPYLDQPQFAQWLVKRSSNWRTIARFAIRTRPSSTRLLDKVIQISKNSVVVERANRYKRGETW